MNRELKTTLFRVFQETLTNIARHAKASKVHVNLNHDNGILHFEIKDNGKGIDKDKLDDSRTVGESCIHESEH